MFIVLAILAFGLIIAVHELGHFIAAKIMGVKVNEFAIGMGPKIFSKQGKETLYSLRLFPFGGFCAMDDDDVSVGEGDNALSKEDEEDDNSADEYNPRSFANQKRWRRIVILAAGSLANFIMAFIIVLVFTAGNTSFTGTTATYVTDNLPSIGPAEIMPGDRFIELNGERLRYYNDINLFRTLHSGRPLIFTIDRNGELITFESRPQGLHRLVIVGDYAYRFIYRYDNSEFIRYERIPDENQENVIDAINNHDEDAIYIPVGRYVIEYNEIDNNFVETIRFSFYQMYDFVRMIRISIVMLIDGAVGVDDFAGPVGIVDAMNTMGQQAVAEGAGIGAGIGNIIFLTAFIGVNVAVVNLLPIPALDGGRILFIFITFIVEKITRKKLNPKYEAYINTGAFILLIGLMIFILYNDIMRLVSGGGILG